MPRLSVAKVVSQYYETSGAVEDMLQNHLIQVLALIAMEPPCKNDAKEVRERKLKFLRN